MKSPTSKQSFTQYTFICVMHTHIINFSLTAGPIMKTNGFVGSKKPRWEYIYYVRRILYNGRRRTAAWCFTRLSKMPDTLCPINSTKEKLFLISCRSTLPGYSDWKIIVASKLIDLLMESDLYLLPLPPKSLFWRYMVYFSSVRDVEL